MKNEVLALLQSEAQKEELTALTACNQTTEQFGLSLSPKDARELIASKRDSLAKYRRVEFSDSILPKLVFTFCDSQYLHQAVYLETLQKLTDMFYEFKNESADQVTDDELLTFMYEQYETVCAGDLSYLEETCLERFSRAVRSGHESYKQTQGVDAYHEFNEETHWDPETYRQVLKELFW
ncbi:MAG: DUF6323 family protein [Lachnospiraceae bacterium]